MNQNQRFEDKEITFRELINSIITTLSLLNGNRAIIVATLLVSGVIGLVAAETSPTEYTATTRLLPYKGQESAGNLSGLASIAGIRLPSSSNQIITSDLYQDIVGSKNFQVRVAESPVPFLSLQGKAVSPINYFDAHNTTTPLNWLYANTVGLPGKLLNYSKKAIRAIIRQERPQQEIKNRPAIGDTSIRSYDPTYIEKVKSVASRVAVAVDAKSGIVTIRATMPDAFAAAGLVKSVERQLVGTIAEYETKKISDQYAFVKKSHEGAQNQYFYAQRKLATFVDRNRSLGSASANVERERLQSEASLAFEVYSELSRNLKQLEIKLNQDTPVFTAIDPVSVPNTRSSPNKGRIVFVAISFGLIVGISVVALKRVLRTPGYFTDDRRNSASLSSEKMA